ncbi:C-terminal binding protein [Polycladidibacter stylochi]|uniref:C-terminal binding protein n=1 Tax=Polycladidibacter stylochi TaxID=1807766 RepID=UPI00082BBFF4|nr:C-terminal binding protein [Pseudovibrio stylochi]
MGDIAAKVVFLEPGYTSYETEKAALSEFELDFVVVGNDASDEERCAAVQDADIVMLRDRVLDQTLLDSMGRAKGIVRYGVGYNNIDYEYAAIKKIPVCNVPDYGADAVAEFAIGLMFAASRMIVSRDKAVRQGAWDISEAQQVRVLAGKTLGLISFGRIARCLKAKTDGIGFEKVIVYDPFLSEAEAKKHNIIKVDMDTLCKESDIVSLHAPLTSETYHLLNAQRIAMMKTTAVVVNTGRGGLIDEDALYYALKNKRLFAAAIDVFENEPVASDHKLFELDNTVVSDHTAWFTVESLRELQTKAGLEAVRMLQGERPKNWINRWD